MIIIGPNGPAIKLVNVTRRPRPGSTTPYFEENVSRPEKEGTARVFAVQAENLIEYYECRGTSVDSAPFVVPGYRVI